MTIGKQKKLGKKGKGRKVIDPFEKNKEWYRVKAPSVFPKSMIGHTVVSRTVGNKLSRDSLMKRVFTVSLGDLKPSGEDAAFRKFKLEVLDVQGSTCLTNFYGMDMATDKLKSLVRKWQSTIEAYCDVKTTDGYRLRLFAIGFTSRRPNQQRKTSYAQSGQIRAIRKKMIDIMKRNAESCELNDLVKKFIPEMIGRDIEKATHGIYPLQNVFIRKVKMIQAPKLEIAKLMELHGGADAIAADAGSAIERVDDAEPEAEAEE
jgi:small subunit ribosomal protein S3Ae